MIEKRTMAVVEKSHRVVPIMAMYDTEKQEVICYKYIDDDDEDGDGENDWYRNFKSERYFNTVQEANEYVAKRQEYLRSKFKEVLEFIEEMDRIAQSYFKFDPKDYLGRYANRNTDSSWYKDELKEIKAKASLLSTIARSRHFNVNGETINIDKVVCVMWHEEYKATLVMSDGHEVKTNSLIEYRVVEEMFGSNRSGKISF